MTSDNTTRFDTNGHIVHTLRVPARNGDDMDPAITSHLDNLRLQGRRPATIYARKRNLARLARALPAPLLDATPDMLLDWRTAMTHTPGVICSYVSHARSFFEWALREGLIADNPAGELPIPRKPRRLPRPIASADLADALDNAGPRMRLWLILASYGGMRCCEIAYLRAENILLGEKPPRIWIAADATKGIRERVIPLYPFAAAELEAARLPVTGYAFRRADGKPGPNAPHHVSHLIAAYLHDAGIPATAHMLRHWFGTHSYRARRDLRATQKLMGHGSPDTTALYTEVDDAAALAAVIALPDPGQLRAA